MESAFFIIKLLIINYHNLRIYAYLAKRFILSFNREILLPEFYWNKPFKT